MPNAAALKVLNHFDFWAAVPLDGSSSYSEIARNTSLTKDVFHCLIQHAITLRIFSETEPSKSIAQVSTHHSFVYSGLFHESKVLVSTVSDDAGAHMMVISAALARYSCGKPALSQILTSHHSFCPIVVGNLENTKDIGIS